MGDTQTDITQLIKLMSDTPGSGYDLLGSKIDVRSSGIYHSVMKECPHAKEHPFAKAQVESETRGLSTLMCILH